MKRRGKVAEEDEEEEEEEEEGGLMAGSRRVGDTTGTWVNSCGRACAITCVFSL